MNLLPILIDVRNAYEAHDRDQLERTLERLQHRLVGTATTAPRHLDPVSLEHRRAEAAADLNAIDAEIQRRQTGDSPT